MKDIDKQFYINNNWFHNPKKLDDIYLIQLGRCYCTDSTVISPHAHLNWFELTVVLDGEATVVTNAHSVEVKSGDIYLSFPYDKHEIKPSCEKLFKYDFLSFYTENSILLTHLQKLITDFPTSSERIIRNERISQLLSSVIAEIHSEKLLASNLLYGLLYTLIVYVIQDFYEMVIPPRFNNVNSHEQLCYQLMNYIDTHLYDLTDLKDFENIANYNYSYLSDLFKKTTKTTLFSYWQNKKLSHAKLLLQEQRLKISEIAELLNYSSVYAFSKAYKNKFGVPPTADRK